MKTLLRKLAIAILPVALAACASSHVLVGTQRPAIDASAVKVYLEPPEKYETVALLEASDLGANGFSAQSRMNKVMKRLKGEAAGLGANGIILQGFDTRYTGSVGTGIATGSATGRSFNATGVGFSSAQSSKEGKAVAIYVSTN